MVLTNKKLKQKLRADLTESLSASVESQNNPNTNNESPNPDSNSQTQESFKSLLDSATQKPRLSKREKRRKTLSLLGPEELKKSSSSGGGDLAKEGVIEKKSKRKRKIDEESETGGSETVENVEETKTKKKKKKKKKKKASNEEVKDDEKIVNRGSDQFVTIKANDRQETEEVATKVYVGGIPYYSTEDDIRSYFEGCGTITEVDCMKFPESGKFRGIAIINFKTDAAAKRALALDGSDMGGLFLKIQPYKSTRAKKASDFTPAIVEGYNRIYVGNLSWDITEDELKKFFSDCSISTIRFGEDKETGEFRGYAHVDFNDSLSVNMALKLDQKIVCGRPVRIRCAVPKQAKQSNSKSMLTSNEAEDNGGTSKETDDNGQTSKEADDNGGTIKEANNGGTSSVSGKIRRRTCYECGEKGHLSSSCPKKQEADTVS